MGAVLSHPFDFVDDLPNTIPSDDSSPLFEILQLFVQGVNTSSLLDEIPR